MVKSQGSFLMVPYKSSSCLRLFSSLSIITLSPEPLCFSSSLKNNCYDKTTYRVSSLAFSYSLALQVTDFPWNPYPQRNVSAKIVSEIHPPFSGVNFSNNVPIPLARVNIKKSEHDTTFILRKSSGETIKTFIFL